jgi:hypothetical protein
VSFPLGQPVPLAVAITDATGSAADATTVALTVTLPDLTTVSPTISHPSTGNYTALYTPTSPGVHRVHWVATGSNASAYSDMFNVDPQLSGAVVSAAEVRAEINETSTADDSELVGFIATATAVVEEMVGSILPTQVTETHNGGGRFIVLHHAPIVSVDSVVEYAGVSAVPLTAQPLAGSVFDGYGYTVDLQAGVLRRQSSGWSWPFAAGNDNVMVTYTYGRQVVPSYIRQAVLELIRVNWRPQRSAGPSLLNPAGSDAPDTAASSQAFYVPEVVRQMLAPAMRAPRVG